MLYSKGVVKRKENKLFHNQIPSALPAVVLLLLGAALSIFWGSRGVFAYTDPATNIAPGTYPTTGLPNLKFLNGANATQQKLGSLVVGSNGGTSALCLNSTISQGSKDSVNCVTSWSAAAAQASGTNQLGYGTLSGSDGLQFSDYLRQVGFVRLKNDNDTVGVNKNQRHSLIVEANTSSSSTYSAIGLYASEGPIGIGPYSSNWAGYFSGNFSVYDETSTSNKTFCLNSTDLVGPGSTKGCIRRWVDYVFGTSGLSYLVLNPSTAQPGRVAVTGTLMSASVQTGSVAGMPLAWTCGDGICSANTSPAETTTSCSLDCVTPSGISAFSASSGINKAFLSATLTATAPYLIVLRKAGSLPTAAPVNGAQYSAGDLVGDATVVIAQTNANVGGWSATDTGLTNGVTYHYSIYAGNAFPLYGAKLSTSATPAAGTNQFTLNFAGITTSDVTIRMHATSGDGSDIDCLSPQACVGAYISGSQVILDEMTIPNTHTFQGFSGDCTGALCSVTMNGSKSVTATFKKKAGPGGGDDEGGGGGQTID
jgi:hypothetical protein